MHFSAQITTFTAAVGKLSKPFGWDFFKDKCCLCFNETNNLLPRNEIAQMLSTEDFKIFFGFNTSVMILEWND